MIERFSLDEETKKLEENERRDLNIIGWFIEKKQPDISSKAQLQVLIKRHLRPAKSLATFNDRQLLKAYERANFLFPDMWTLETLVKLLTK